MKKKADGASDELQMDAAKPGRRTFRGNATKRQGEVRKAKMLLVKAKESLDRLRDSEVVRHLTLADASEMQGLI